MESIFYYLAAANVMAFLLVWIDKRKAVQGAYRIPERTFWTIALLGGAIGTYAGMQHFRHKTKHKSFMIGIPIIMVVNVILFIYLS